MPKHKREVIELNGKTEKDETLEMLNVEIETLKAENEALKSEIKLLKESTFNVTLKGHWLNHKPNETINVDRKTYYEMHKAGIIY